MIRATAAPVEKIELKMSAAPFLSECSKNEVLTYNLNCAVPEPDIHLEHAALGKQSRYDHLLLASELEMGVSSLLKD